MDLENLNFEIKNKTLISFNESISAIKNKRFLKLLNNFDNHKKIMIFLNEDKIPLDELIKIKIQIDNVGTFVAYFLNNIEESEIQELLKSIKELKKYHNNDKNIVLNKISKLFNLFTIHNAIFASYEDGGKSILKKDDFYLNNELGFKLLLVNITDNENNIIAKKNGEPLFSLDMLFECLFGLFIGFSFCCGISLASIQFLKSFIFFVLCLCYIFVSSYGFFKIVFDNNKMKNKKTFWLILSYLLIGSIGGSLLSFLILEKILHIEIEIKIWWRIALMLFSILLSFVSFPLSFLFNHFSKIKNHSL